MTVADRPVGHLGGHLEIHHVAFVVLDDESMPAPVSTASAAADHLVGRRRGEHLAGAGGIEHAVADEAGMQRLVTGAAAGNQRNLARPQFLPADELVLCAKHEDIRMRGNKAVEALGENCSALLISFFIFSPPRQSSPCRRCLKKQLVNAAHKRMHHLVDAPVASARCRDPADQS